MSYMSDRDILERREWPENQRSGLSSMRRGVLLTQGDSERQHQRPVVVDARLLQPELGRKRRD